MLPNIFIEMFGGLFMLNYIWTGLLILGFVVGAFNGRMSEISTAVVDSAEAAVSLCITMLGVMTLWSGIMQIARRAGLLDSLTNFMLPVIRWLFPKIPKGHPANGYIATNFVANILGLGWAATPAGLKAMESLSDLSKQRKHSWHIATNEMCTFLILNISSLQLIPISIIAYRSQYQSVAATAITGPAIIATTISTVVAVVFCKIMDRQTSH